jgi:hypothetical protein
MINIVYCLFKKLIIPPLPKGGGGYTVLLYPCSPKGEGGILLRIGEIYILKTGCSDSNDFLSILWDIHFCKC